MCCGSGKGSATHAGAFYATANKQHQGGLDNAVFLADPASDTIEIVLLTHGLRQDFKEGGREVALPSEVLKAIGNMEKP